MIPQDPVIFNASLRENLSLATSLDPQATGAFDDATLLQALERVGLTQWLKRFSQPLEMMIEEKGKNLSQGEKQLLVMARMSLIQRPLVLMDEATSSIDPKTEELLVNAMSEIFRGHTQLIIAHRLSTIETCDRILWLKDGKVALFDKPEIVIRSFKSSDIGA